VWDSNPEAYKKSRYALRRTIEKATRQYRANIESYYTGSDARRMWQVSQTITDYKGKHSRELPSDTSLSDRYSALRKYSAPFNFVTFCHISGFKHKDIKLYFFVKNQQQVGHNHEVE
jgi:hypothetical protein